MTQFVKLGLAAAALGALVACGGSGEEMVGPPPPPPPPTGDTPLAPSIGDATVITGRSNLNRINGMRDTQALAILPSGTATFNGRAITSLAVSGDPSIDGMYGSMNMRAELRGGDAVTGSITNLHTLTGNRPVEKLTGQIGINGTLADGSKNIAANLTGTVGGVFGDGEASNLRVSGTMAGDLKREQTGTNIIGLPTYNDAAGAAGTIQGRFSGDQAATFSGDWAVD